MTRDFSREQRGRVSVLTNGGHAADPRGTVFGGGYAKTGGDDEIDGNSLSQDIANFSRRD